MKKIHRTFIAVEINNAVRDRAKKQIAALAGTSADVKWVEPHNLHFTLKFLGDVHQHELLDVCRAVAREAAKIPAFDLEVCGVGAFPNSARPRTVWIGAKEGVASMITLHDQIEAALAPLGYREEHRQFQPHLTIGRVRGIGEGVAKLGSLLQQYADAPLGVIDVQKATIFISTLTPDGPIYEVVGSATLGKA